MEKLALIDIHIVRRQGHLWMVFLHRLACVVLFQLPGFILQPNLRASYLTYCHKLIGVE